MYKKENEKAMNKDAALTCNKVLKNPDEIGTELFKGKTIVGIFHDQEAFKGAQLINVYKIKNDVLFNMILLPNRELHLMQIRVNTDEEYRNSEADLILFENEVVFTDAESVIDVSKAIMPDSISEEDAESFHQMLME